MPDDAPRTQPPHRRRTLARRAGFRLAVSVVVGVIAGCLTATVKHELSFALMTGWVALAAVFAVWTWGIVGRMNEHEAATYAQEEDPSVTVADSGVLVATVASLAGVGFLLVAGRHKNGSGTAEAVLGTLSVVASWFLVHLTYVLRYARLYYSGSQGNHGIDFEGGEPDYYDFAYVAFDLGMTYQIADTNLKNRQMRRLVLGHMLLSYLLGVGVVATTINLVTSLASN